MPMSEEEFYAELIVSIPASERVRIVAELDRVVTSF